MLESAEKLVSQGFSVFPIVFKNKIPLTPNGFKDASNSFEQLKKWDEKFSYYNIGIKTGNGISVVDIDPRNGGTESWIDILEDNELPDTVCAITGGGGRHYFFKAETKCFANKLGKGIDIKGEGGYVVASPSIHPNGNKYEWLPNYSPDDLEMAELPDFLNPNKINKTDTDNELDTTGYQANEVPSLLEETESGSRNDTIARQAGKYIKKGLEFKEVLEICLLSNLKNKPPLPESEVRKTVESIFRTNEVNNPKIEGLKKHVEKPSDVINLTDAQLDVGGLIGQMCDEINSNAYLKQPILTFAGVLTFFATVIGRYYKLRCDTRTNLYTVGIADSGSGKQGVINAVEIIADKAGLSNLIDAEDVTSGQAILKAVEHSPTRAVYFPFDEIGDMLASVSGKNSANFEREKAKVFTTLYTSSNKTYRGKRFASGNRTELNQPLVSFYGTGNPSDFFEAVTPKMIKSGFFGRILCFFPNDNDPAPNYDSERLEPSRQLINDLAQWANLMPAYNPDDLNSAICPEPIIIETSNKANKVFREFDDIFRKRKIDFKDRKNLDCLWVRPLVIAKKIALVLTCSNCRTPRGIQNERPEISEKVARQACELVLTCFDRICIECELNVTASDFELIQRDLIKCVKRYGRKGASKSDLCRELRRWSPVVRDQAVQVLLESGLLFKQVKTEGKKRPETRFFQARI